MKDIIVDIVKRYAWECSECGCYNIQELCSNTVECEECSEEFNVAETNDIS